MTTALRPMSTGEVLDRTFNLYRNNFQLFAGIATVLSLVNLIGSLIVILLTQGISGPSPSYRDPAALGVQILIWAFGYIFFLLIGYALSLGATIYAVSQVHLGKKTNIRECYRKIRSQVWSLINIVVSIFCRAFGAFFLVYFAAAIFAFAVGRMSIGELILIILVCGFFAGVVCGLAVICKYAFAVPTRLLENFKSNRFLPLSWRVPLVALVGGLLVTLASIPVLAGVIAGALGGLAWVSMVMPRPILKRSKELSKGSRFRIFIVLLLVFVLYFGFAWGLQYGGAQVLATIPYALIAWSLLAGFVASTLAFPILNIAFSLFYYDERIRKEAFDLQLMMEAVGQVAPAQSAAAVPSIG